MAKAVMIKFGDRERRLRFGHKALKYMTASLGNGDINALEKDDFSFEELEAIFFYGLMSDAKAHGEILKKEDMEDLLDTVDYQVLIDAMQEAFTEAFGDKATLDVEGETTPVVESAATTGTKD